jgi:hypothetical protein
MRRVGSWTSEHEAKPNEKSWPVLIVKLLWSQWSHNLFEAGKSLIPHQPVPCQKFSKYVKNPNQYKSLY